MTAIAKAVSCLFLWISSSELTRYTRKTYQQLWYFLFICPWVYRHQIHVAVNTKSCTCSIPLQATGVVLVSLHNKLSRYTWRLTFAVDRCYNEDMLCAPAVLTSCSYCQRKVRPRTSRATSDSVVMATDCMMQALSLGWGAVPSR